MRVSEVFYSLQGEGLLVGHPSVFIRFFGCNFRCPGFGMPKGQHSNEADDVADMVITHRDQYPTYESLPLVKTGCDSYPSWHPKLKDYSPDITAEELLKKVKSAIPANVKSVDVVFTGGEPLLPGTQKSIVDFLKIVDFHVKHITFETNGTMRLTEQLKCQLSSCNVVFSVSPKLTCSGVPKDKAIRYDVWNDIDSFTHSDSTKKWYVKFVVSNTEDVDEVEHIINDSYVPVPEVYIMPEGGTESRYNDNLKHVADIALNKGYVLSPRLHVSLYGNSWAK